MPKKHEHTLAYNFLIRLRPELEKQITLSSPNTPTNREELVALATRIERTMMKTSTTGRRPNPGPNRGGIQHQEPRGAKRKWDEYKGYEGPTRPNNASAAQPNRYQNQGMPRQPRPTYQPQQPMIDKDTCRRCKKKGHWDQDCPQNPQRDFRHSDPNAARIGQIHMESDQVLTEVLTENDQVSTDAPHRRHEDDQ
jgi:hypothetical protein